MAKKPYDLMEALKASLGIPTTTKASERMKTFYEAFPSRDYLPSANTAFERGQEIATEHYEPRIKALEAEVERLSARIDTEKTRADCAIRARDSHWERIKSLEAALRELTAMVRGECPALLRDDSGGDAVLSMLIDDLLGARP